MLKRACLCVLLLAATACDNPNPLTAPTNSSPVYIAIGPATATPFSVTFQGQLITTPGSYLFDIPAGEGVYSIEGTFSHGALDFGFSGGDVGQGGVTSGSVVVAKGPGGASTRPCGVGWALSGNAATVGQEFEVRFTVTKKSSRACQ